MTNQNIDDIRVFDTEANLIAGARIRPGMLSFATDTHRMIRKKLSDSTFTYWSDDSKQVLLDGAQTIIGNKTSSGTWNFTGIATFSEIAKISNELVFTPKIVSSITDGVTNLDPSDTAHIQITKDNTLPASNTAGILAGATFGQILLISCSDRSSIEIDDSVSSSAEIYFDSGTVTKLQLDIRETALFVWVEGIAGNNAWHLIATTGATS